MRATECNAFRRECEQSENDLQAMQAEIVQEQAERKELRSIAFNILGYFNLIDYIDQFVSCLDGLAILLLAKGRSTMFCLIEGHESCPEKLIVEKLPEVEEWAKRYQAEGDVLYTSCSTGVYPLPFTEELAKGHPYYPDWSLYHVWKIYLEDIGIEAMRQCVVDHSCLIASRTS